MSYESTIKYYNLIFQKYYEKYDDYNYPELVIFSLNFQKIINYELSGERAKYIDYLMRGIKALENGGVNFIVMAANSPHAVHEDLQKLSEVPILSIVETTANKAIQEKMKKTHGLIEGLGPPMLKLKKQNHTRPQVVGRQ